MLDMHKNGDLIEELKKVGIRSVLLDSDDSNNKKSWSGWFEIKVVLAYSLYINLTTDLHDATSLYSWLQIVLLILKNYFLV